MGTVHKVGHILFIVHTDDHGFPHVTVYMGTPANHEARAKIRLDNTEVIESYGWSRKALKGLVETTEQFKDIWMEEWNEIEQSKKG